MNVVSMVCECCSFANEPYSSVPNKRRGYVYEMALILWGVVSMDVVSVDVVSMDVVLHGVRFYGIWITAGGFLEPGQIGMYPGTSGWHIWFRCAAQARDAKYANGGN